MYERCLKLREVTVDTKEDFPACLEDSTRKFTWNAHGDGECRGLRALFLVWVRQQSADWCFLASGSAPVGCSRECGSTCTARPSLPYEEVRGTARFLSTSAECCHRKAKVYTRDDDSSIKVGDEDSSIIVVTQSVDAGRYSILWNSEDPTTRFVMKYTFLHIWICMKRNITDLI